MTCLLCNLLGDGQMDEPLHGDGSPHDEIFGRPNSCIENMRLLEFVDTARGRVRLRTGTNMRRLARTLHRRRRLLGLAWSNADRDYVA